MARVLLRLSLFIFLWECVVHLSIKCSFLFDVWEWLTNLWSSLGMMIFRKQFLSVEGVRLRHWHLMLLTIASIFSYLQLSSICWLNGILFTYGGIILWSWNWIIIICYIWYHILLITSIHRLAIIFCIFAMTWSFTVSTHLTCIRHFYLTHILILIITNNERSAGCWWTDMGTESFTCMHATIFTTLKFCLIWIQNNWWW